MIAKGKCKHGYLRCHGRSLWVEQKQSKMTIVELKRKCIGTSFQMIKLDVACGRVKFPEKNGR